MPRLRGLALPVTLTLLIAACGGGQKGGQPPPAPPAARTSILFVTLDTTRADAIGPEAVGIRTPAFDALASKGRRFRQAYATVPETLPSHASMMTGLYPAGHLIHENGRFLSDTYPVLAERLHQAGYRTAAFVSSFILARRFGLARGFDLYDDQLQPGREERSAVDTTDRAVAYLGKESGQPLFLWVHYFDPHYPYEPPEPFRSQFAGNLYLGEIAAMDQQLGRLVQAFEQQVRGPTAIIVVGDHGEGRGDHGEALHGNLLYQSTMHVPLVIVTPAVSAGVSDQAVSARRVFHTALDLAGLDSTLSLRGPAHEVVLGEAMKPFLEYGWQPQVMAVEAGHKSILAGRIETYDMAADPREERDLQLGPGPKPPVPVALRDYPVPSPSEAPSSVKLDEEARRSLASLGYVNAGAAPVVRKDAPRPADMVSLFDAMEKASGLFVSERYAQVIPLLEKILVADPYNLDAMLRLATAHSALGHDSQAVSMFQRAAVIAPGSLDVRTYLALHYARGAGWERAVPMLERVVAESPERMPALEALATLEERQGRLREAIELRKRIYLLRSATPAELVHLGQTAMEAGQTALAIDSFQKARGTLGQAFSHDLELGVLYLANRQYEEARACLDRVPPTHPEYAMALFKRAQVSVLLNEPDRLARIGLARRHADASTRELISRERLFQNVRTP